MRPSRLQMLMEVAQVVSKRSTCNRLSVGAVIAREGRILTMGYNGPASGLPHCNHTNGKPCDQAVHAETNAIAFAARWGISTDGAELYVTHQPCLKCAQLIVNAGIAKIYFSEVYRDQSGIELLREANIKYEFYSFRETT